MRSTDIKMAVSNMCVQVYPLFPSKMIKSDVAVPRQEIKVCGRRDSCWISHQVPTFVDTWSPTVSIIISVGKLREAVVFVGQARP